jgi:integrase
MPARRLTAENTGSLKPRLGRARDVYFDRTKGAPPGFALRVAASGVRSYYLVYRPPGGARKRWLFLGNASKVSLADARQAARHAESLRARGKDPIEERVRETRERELRPTVAGLVARFIEAGEGKKGEVTLREYERILRSVVDPSKLGKASATEVTAPELDALFRRVAKRAPVMANRVYQLVRASFHWGFRKDLIERDVAAKIEKPYVEEPLSSEERTLSDEEITRVWRGTEQLQSQLAAFIRIPLLCGTRRGETALAEWKEFDLEAGTWSIPPEHRKGRVGRRRGLVLPLSPLAVRVLRSRRAAEEGPVFGEVGQAFLVNPHRMMERVRKATGVAFSLHDLRATCATGAGRCGAAPHVVALILGHSVMPGAPEVTSRYDRADRFPEVARALDAWARHVGSLVAEPEAERVARLRLKGAF